LNGTAKNTLKERDFGYSIGGPIGKPGKANRLFFFYSHEYAPRSQGGGLNDFRVPTALERNGDFSQTLDNNGNLYNLIKDPQLTAACNASSTGAAPGGCFADGGVLGKIPANRFYSLGQAILNQYPMPNISGAGLGYNYETTQAVEKALAWQPAVRVDYQPSTNLRMTYKYSGWKQATKTFAGTMPTITQSDQYKPIVSTTAITTNYTFNPSTFIEATFGHSQNELAGCGLAQGGTGPTYCTSGIPTSPQSNRVNAGLGALPMLFPDALKLNPSYYAYQVLSDMAPPMFQNGQVLKTPNFTFGGRVANSPPNSPFSGFLNKNSTYDISTSLTKVWGHHTLKGGFLQHAQLEGAAAELGRHLRHVQLPEFHGQPARLDVPLRECDPGHRHVVQPVVDLHRGHVCLQQHGRLRAGQLEGQPEADAGLRRPVRPPAAAVRQARAGVELPAGEIPDRPGPLALHRWVRQWRGDVLGHEPVGD